MQINPRTIAEAIKGGDTIYELVLTNWGNCGVLKDANAGSLQYPAVKLNANGSIPLGVPFDTNAFTLPTIPGLAAIAISPRSNVDRAVVRYQTLPPVAATFQNLPLTSTVGLTMPCEIDQGFFNKGGVLQSETQIAVGAPLIGVQPGPIVIRADSSGWFTDQFRPLGGGSLPFGTTLGAVTSLGYNAPVWVNPELRVLLYFQGAVALPPQLRAPFHLMFHATPPTESGLIRVVPVMGRRHAKVTVRNRTAGDANVRISGIVTTVTAASNTPPFGAPDCVEVALTASTAVTANQSATFAYDHPNVAFLMIYADQAAPAGMDFSIDAFDA